MAIYAPCILNGTCPLCNKDNSEDADTVAHTYGGEGHPAHRKCLNLFFEKNDPCPSCSLSVDKNSILTFREKIFKEIRHMPSKMAYGGIFVSAVASTITNVSLAMLSLTEKEATFEMVENILPIVGTCFSIVYVADKAIQTATRACCSNALLISRISASLLLPIGIVVATNVFPIEHNLTFLEGLAFNMAAGATSEVIRGLLEQHAIGEGQPQLIQAP